eukprot:TRINITY_DN7416_c0_g1_i2.p1 TRINITY_DN7416_c0_g1~~TRINITY_DN7416_c0_g1_i2.p1  ORF type:complete len:100 (+),score=4.16 TRINITY_DN7416_c0_g1_i2:317-616(+)
MGGSFGKFAGNHISTKVFYSLPSSVICRVLSKHTRSCSKPSSEVYCFLEGVSNWKTRVTCSIRLIIVSECSGYISKTNSANEGVIFDSFPDKSKDSSSL